MWDPYSKSKKIQRNSEGLALLLLLKPQSKSNPVLIFLRSAHHTVLATLSKSKIYDQSTNPFNSNTLNSNINFDKKEFALVKSRIHSKSKPCRLYRNTPPPPPPCHPLASSSTPPSSPSPPAPPPAPLSTSIAPPPPLIIHKSKPSRFYHHR